MKPDQLSNTAAFIGIKFYGLTRDQRYRDLFDDEIIQFYDKLIQFLPAPLHYYHRGLKLKILRRFFTFWEELLLPGDLMHIILRKWYLSRWVEQLRKNDFRQMLVLGAGFDHLASINAPRNIYSVELDTSRMIRLKRNFLVSNSYDHLNLNLQEAFFPDDALDDILGSKTKLDAAAKTIVVAEGFFDYLSPQTSADILTQLNSYFKGPLRLLSTTFALQELSGFRGFVYRNSIKLAGETLKLSLDKDGYVTFLKNHGFDIKKLIGKHEMQAEVLEPYNINYPILDGFYLIEAGKEITKN